MEVLQYRENSSSPWQHIAAIKGEKGDPGGPGPEGQPGPQGVSITSVKQITTSTVDDGNNVIQVTLSNGQNSTFKVKNGSKGSNGGKGDPGANATITGATASITNTVGTPKVTVTPKGEPSARSFDFKFENLKGDKGDRGLGGAPGKDGLTTKISVNGTTYTQSGGTITLPNYPTKSSLDLSNVQNTADNQKDVKSVNGYTIVESTTPPTNAGPKTITIVKKV